MIGSLMNVIMGMPVDLVQSQIYIWKHVILLKKYLTQINYKIWIVAANISLVQLSCTHPPLCKWQYWQRAENILCDEVNHASATCTKTFVITVPADAPASDDARPSAGTMLTANLDIFKVFPAFVHFEYWFVDKEISIKMTTRSHEISLHLKSLEKLRQSLTCHRFRYSRLEAVREQLLCILMGFFIYYIFNLYIWIFFYWRKKNIFYSFLKSFCQYAFSGIICLSNFWIS